MTCGSSAGTVNMTFSFGLYPYIAPGTNRWHDRATCDICKLQDKQMSALKVHCLSRAFAYRTRCGE